MILKRNHEEMDFIESRMKNLLNDKSLSVNGIVVQVETHGAFLFTLKEIIAVLSACFGPEPLNPQK